MDGPSQLLLALRWYLTVQLFGLAALPLALRLFRHLPGQGYSLARPLGLLAAGWVFWLSMVFGWLPNTAGAVVAALALVAALGITLWLRPPAAPVSPAAKRPTIRHILAVELVFTLAFAAWCVVRAHMPRIETAGGEKWMEIAFLDAVLRAPRFPPQDPWLSGFAVSYYYFGYVMMGILTRLAAVPAPVGFNLGIATLFALTCTGAYGLVYSLLAAESRSQATWGGLLGPLLVAVTGNLEGLLEVLHARGLLPAAFWRWLDIRSINVPPPPLARGSWLPIRPIWWWQASRVLHDYAPWHTPASPAEWEVIDEFPSFSFLLGDMHPHLLALPFALLALALALNLFSRRYPSDRPHPAALAPLPRWEMFMYALCLGGLGFLNTWDFPIYLFVVVAAFALRIWSLAQRNRAVFALRTLGLAAVLAGGGFALYLPFWLGLRSQAAGIAPNLFNGTRLPQFLVMFGPLLLPVAALTAAEGRRQRVKGREMAAWTAGALLGLLLFLVLAGLISPYGRQYLAAWRSGGPIPGLEYLPQAPRLIAARLEERLSSPWTALGLAVLLTGGLLALRRGAADEERPLPDTRSYVLLLVTTGALLTLAVEFVYLRDHFGTRMNTVFKFYFQAWVMWGIAAAYSLARGRLSGSAEARRPSALTALAFLMVAAGLIYPALALPSRAREFGAPPTLDGAEHLRALYGADMKAIDWLNQNVSGTPVILEAPGDGYRAYIYEGRVSAFTGLPTLLGWGGHEHQWRGDYTEPARREPDIEALYTTTDLTLTLTLLRRYDISYVYVGSLERSRYPAAGLAKFAQLLLPVYEADGVTIYYHTSAVLPGRTPIPFGAEPE